MAICLPGPCAGSKVVNCQFVNQYFYHGVTAANLATIYYIKALNPYPLLPKWSISLGSAYSMFFCDL